MFPPPADPLSANGKRPKRLIFRTSIAAILFLCFWYAFDIILLAFAGALLAIILHACADWVQRHTPKVFGPRLSYTATILGTAALACVIGYFLVPRAISEAGQVFEIIPESRAQVSVHLDKTDWGRHVEHFAHQFMSGYNFGSRISSLTDAVGTAVEYTVVIVVVGLYGALYVREYRKGLLAWIPEARRQSFLRISRGVTYTLRWWMIGQLAPMAVLGVATMIGLWALSVPLAFTLGLLTGVMIFIPYVGSWIAFVPTVLVSLTRGPHTALYVTIMYLVIHLIEGYVLTPMVQKRAVLLPPF